MSRMRCSDAVLLPTMFSLLHHFFMRPNHIFDNMLGKISLQILLSNIFLCILKMNCWMLVWKLLWRSCQLGAAGIPANLLPHFSCLPEYGQACCHTAQVFRNGKSVSTLLRSAEYGQDSCHTSRAGIRAGVVPYVACLLEYGHFC